MHFMTSQNFTCDNDGTLTHNLRDQGYSLILFHSTQCQHCDKAKSIFRHLADTVVGCEFGMINLDTNKGVIATCNKSNLKLEYVPLLVFFAKGRAYMMYSGPLNESNIRQFIEQVAFAYAEEYNKRPSNQRTLISDVEGCAMDDEVCKEDYIKKQQGVYRTLKEAYSNKSQNTTGRF